jgi:hypothetical protein
MVGKRIVADVGVPEFGQMALAAPGKGAKQPGRNFHFPEKYGIPSPRFSGAEHEPSVREAMSIKTPGMNWSDPAKRGQDFTRLAGQHLKNSGANTWFGIQSNGDRYPGQPGNPVNGTKNGNDWFSSGAGCSLQRKASSKSLARKHASALIAKIPFPLARHVGRIFRPENGR